MPCVNLTESECPCWTPDELKNVADGELANSCKPVQSYDASIFGSDKSTGVLDLTFADKNENSASLCIYVENSPRTSRFMTVEKDQASACITSIQRECKKRGLSLTGINE